MMDSTLDSSGNSKGSSGRTFVVDSEGFIKIKQKDNTAIQKVEVAEEDGTVISTRKKLNFIEGQGINVTVADNAPGDRADITISFETEAITKAQITSNQNDYDVTGGQVYRISSDATRNITGLSGTGYRAFFNHGANRIRFTNEDVLSVAANRIITGTGVLYQMNAGESVEFLYDTTSLRWRRLM